MRVFLIRLIEILFAFAILKYINLFNNVPLSNFGLLMLVATWLNCGHLLKKRLHYQGLFSNWYAPIVLVNETVVSCCLAALTFFCMIKLKEYLHFDLLLSILFALSFIYFLRLLSNKYTIPLFLTITFFSAVEIYLLQLNFIGQEKLNLYEIKYLVIIETILLSLSTIVNLLFLRNYIFYQKLITKTDNKILLTYNQRFSIAIHEAAHLLLYIYFKDIPQNIEVLLFNKAKKIHPDSEGLVLAKIPVFHTASFIQWRMMLSISGIRGELLIFNNHTHGSESDFQQWRELCHIYLSNFDRRYVNQPLTAKEFSQNKKLETNLYNYQIQIIDDFLKINRKILVKTAKKSLVFNKLNYKEIYPLLKQVKLIKGIPTED